MKAFLIAPDHGCACTVVTEVDVRSAPDGGADLRHVYELLDCSLVEIVEAAMTSPLAGHVLVVDEEGLLKPHAGYLFMPRLYPTPIAGKVLVFAQGSGDDDDPVLAAALVSIDEVRQEIGRCYCSPQFARVALRLHEDFMRRRFPEAIVIPVSDHIRTV
jgi:hypothetical protein